MEAAGAGLSDIGYRRRRGIVRQGVYYRERAIGGRPLCEAAGTCLGVLYEPGDRTAREIQRSAGVNGRRSRMLDFQGHSLIKCTH